ncbi:MAG: TMEM175 family protein [Microthrixaceae bacterium]
MSTDAADRNGGRTHPRWERGENPEFDRFGNFTDAVFAIAMTLLVLDVRIAPILRDSGDPSVMWSRLSDLVPQLIAFGVAFILLGFYWIAHHQFVSRLGAFDHRLMALNLVYLAFVALLPFPSALVGEYEENPVSVIVFAITLAVISAMETVMFVYAHRSGCLRDRLTPWQYRFEVLASLQPVAVFLVTLPLAYVNTTLTLISWAFVSPIFGAILHRIARHHAVAGPAAGEG